MSEIEIRKVECRNDKELQEGRREEETILEKRVVYINRVDKVLSTLVCDCTCEELDRLFATNGAVSRPWDPMVDGPWYRWARCTLPWDMYYKYLSQDRDRKTWLPIWQNARRVVYAVWFCGGDGGPTFEVRRK